MGTILVAVFLLRGKDAPPVVAPEPLAVTPFPATPENRPAPFPPPTPAAASPGAPSELSLEEVSPLPSRPATAYNDDGLALCKGKNYEGAVQAFKCATKAKPENPEFWNNVGYAYQMIGRYETSNYYCRRALELSPNRTAAFGNIAYNEVKLGREDQAVSSWMQYLNSFSSDAKRERGIAFLRKIAVSDEDPRVGSCIQKAFENLRIHN